MQNFINKSNEFLKQIQLKPEYKHLDISLEFSVGNGHNGLSVSDNGRIMLDRSNAVARELSEFIKSAYEEARLTDSVDVRIVIAKSDSDKQIEVPKAEPKTQEQPQTDDAQKKSVFVAVTPKYKLEDVILADETMKNIEEAIATIKSFDMVYNQWNFKSKEPSAKTNICFWGAPGTGKTMCAHAIADYLGKNILIASYADIQSEYVGVGPKNLREVFQQAEVNNALLFFDEADSFLRKRTSDNSNSASMHYNSMTNEMMKHLEDFNGVVIFATNLTENTDEAFKTRISYSVEFKVPDEKCRARIIQKMIPPQVPLAHPFTDDDYAEMAKVTDKFVGRDIRNSVKSILSVGAQKGTFPFTKDAFIEGFKTYYANKENFNKGMKKDAGGANAMDIYTANGCIHNLLAYAAWVDGPENEKETDALKLFSKILTRNKLVITKISDLPSLEEICQEIKDISLKKKALMYLAYFMATSEQEEKNLSLINDVAKILKVESDVVDAVMEYYASAKSQIETKNKINNLKTE